MPKPQFLVRNRHNSRYYFRGHIPIDLRPHFGGKAEFRVSLGTSDKAAAKRKALKIWVELQATFDHIREAILTDNSATQRLQGQLLIEKAKAALARGENKSLRQQLQWAEADAKRGEKRASQVARDAVTALAGGQATCSESAVTPTPFGQVAREYMNQYKRVGGKGKPPAPSTLGKKQEKVDFWIGLYGERQIHEFSKADIGKVLDFIYDLPANSSKLYESPAKAVEAALNGHEHKSLNAGKTVVDYLHSLADIFKFSCGKGYIETNPATHLYEVKQHTETATIKPPFSNDDLLKIFPANYGDGFQRNRNPDPVKMTARFWLPLLSLFSGARLEELCQLRVDDVATCSESNVPFYRITNEGEAHDGQAKRTKNKNSVRLIPIHPRLIEIGFLDFVEERRACNGDSAGLFALKRGEGERMGKGVSHWFSRQEKRTSKDGGVYYIGGYMESKGVQKTGEVGSKPWSKSFHTLRHTLINHLRNQKHPTTGEEFTEEQIDQLTGHKKSQSGVNLYTQDGLKVMKLRKAAITAAMAVDYDFLPLDRIRWENFKSEYLQAPHRR